MTPETKKEHADLRGYLIEIGRCGVDLADEGPLHGCARLIAEATRVDEDPEELYEEVRRDLTIGTVAR